MSSSNHEDFEIQFYTKEYDNIVTKGLALKNEYDKIKILLMNAWYEQVKALNKASKDVYKIKEEIFTTNISEKDLQERNWYLSETNVGGAVPKYVYREFSNTVTWFIEESKLSEEFPSETIFIYKNTNNELHLSSEKLSGLQAKDMRLAGKWNKETTSHASSSTSSVTSTIQKSRIQKSSQQIIATFLVDKFSKKRLIQICEELKIHPKTGSKDAIAYCIANGSIIADEDATMS